MKDFTLSIYRQFLLALQQAGYSFFTFENWCDRKAVGKYVILRHDIDNKPTNALEFAKLESELGIQSTFFFRTSAKILVPKIIKEIGLLGHEIGYHYRDLVDTSGNSEKAITLFRENLSKLRSIANVRTISMDGCPWSKFDNRDLWKTYNYRDYGIIGEPYFDFLNPISPINDLKNKVMYITDTARMWDGDKFNVRDKVIDQLSVNSNQLSVNNNNNSTTQQSTIHSTFDFIDWLQTNPVQNVIMITTHPQRWTNKPVEWLLELVLQNAKNRIKRLIVRKG